MMLTHLTHRGSAALVQTLIKSLFFLPAFSVAVVTEIIFKKLLQRQFLLLNPVYFFIF